MVAAVLYKGDDLLGEVVVYLQKNKKAELRENRITITCFSPPSERCPPLAVLHAVADCGVCFKMEAIAQLPEAPLFSLHSSCLRENKTAVMPLGEEEIHLVAMPSREHDGPFLCFWGFVVASGLYSSCLAMLNLRCLGIVFDLDETLVVANTMRSFEDKIEALQRKLNTEMDPQRISGMLAEVKRYQDDKIILKQYVENDQVVENGKIIKIQSEVIPALSDSHPPIVRPLIRLQDKNIILTRINPLIRDTSVLVRLRPAWEDLRSYLMARGRKRFEVYVCTMAERDYALEMWRLLDPDTNLINSKELLGRIVCVKPGSRKSLYNVFQDGICHPKMALVIDDRLKVWDEKDQPRVHVVPAFAPYYAPQAEANNAPSVLCLARNVACNVRGGFFKEFDDSLLQRIHEVCYEDDFRDIPSPPDVSNYLVSEDDGSTSNGNKDLFFIDGMADVEVERRLKDSVSVCTTFSSTLTNLDPRIAPSLQFPVASSSSSSVPLSTPQGFITPFINKPPPLPSYKPSGNAGPAESSLQSSPAREEGEVPESELDPDTRRRLLILQHGQDTRDNPPSETSFPVRPPKPVPVPQAPPHETWFPTEEEMNPRQLNQSAAKEFPLDLGPMLLQKQRSLHSSFYHGAESSISPGKILHDNHRLSKEELHTDDRLRLNHPVSSYHSISGEEVPSGQISLSNRDLNAGSVWGLSNVDTPAGVLQRIAMKCGTRVEFRPNLVASNELQFSIEVWFAGERIGEGIGRTRKEAQCRAAGGSLKNLAYKYLSNGNHDSSSTNGDLNRSFSVKENGFLSDVNYLGSPVLPKEEALPSSTASEPPRLIENSKKSMGTVSALKELCMMEGLAIAFQAPSLVPSSIQTDEVYTQVEIDGQVLGKGLGITWDEAKAQAAEEALGCLRSMLGQFSQKRRGSPMSFRGMPNKHLKPDVPRPSHMPSPARYSKHMSLVP